MVKWFHTVDTCYNREHRANGAVHSLVFLLRYICNRIKYAISTKRNEQIERERKTIATRKGNLSRLSLVCVFIFSSRTFRCVSHGSNRLRAKNKKDFIYVSHFIKQFRAKIPSRKKWRKQQVAAALICESESQWSLSNSTFTCTWSFPKNTHFSFSVVAVSHFRADLGDFISCVPSDTGNRKHFTSDELIGRHDLSMSLLIYLRVALITLVTQRKVELQSLRFLVSPQPYSPQFRLQNEHSKLGAFWA